MGMVIYLKYFWKYNDADSRGEEAWEHNIPKSFEVIFKIMKAGTIMNMVEEELHHHYFIIGFIVSNNYSTIQDVLKHPGARDQVLK